MHRRRNFLKEKFIKIPEMIISVFIYIKQASVLFLTKPNLNNRPMNI